MPIKKTASEAAELINETRVAQYLRTAVRPDNGKVLDVLAKAKELKGLDPREAAILLNSKSPEMLEQIFTAAKEAKESIYGNRLVLFAPLYISNLCENNCLYCAFRTGNKGVRRKVLTQKEIAQEVRLLVRSGQKRVLLVTGEEPEQVGLKFILDSIKTIYSTKVENGEIRRINVNVAPMTVDEFRELKSCGIGTYQLFQETYHRRTYRKVHVSGPKSNYDWRLTAMDRAFEAGIDDMGIGVLFGLYDYRFEVLALLYHIQHLEQRFGVGCHTISVPRLEPACGSVISMNPPYPVSDEDFKKIVAVLRLAVSYTGIIMSTRETPEMRASTLSLGVSQISASSRTNPGGYAKSDSDSEQFQLGDHRSLDEIVLDMCEMGYIPSFCTACYRLGRTGGDFMDLAKPGLIKQFCLPNALLTFKEYIEDFASPETRLIGERIIEKNLLKVPGEKRRNKTGVRIKDIERGERDQYF